MLIKKLWPVLLALCVVTVAGLVIDLLLEPTKTMRVGHYLVLWPTLGLALFAIGRVLRAKLAPGRLRRSYGLLVGFGSVLAPLFIIGPLERTVNSLGIERIEQQLRPLIERLEADPITAPETLIDTLGEPRDIDAVNIHQSPLAYLVETGMTSIDIDGYTVFHVTGGDGWQHFHNDQPDDLPVRVNHATALRTVIADEHQSTTAFCRPATGTSCADDSTCITSEHWRCDIEIKSRPTVEE